MKKTFLLIALVLFCAFNTTVFADIEPNGHPLIANIIEFDVVMTGMANDDEKNSFSWNIGGGQYEDWYKFVPDFSGKVRVTAWVEQVSSYSALGGDGDTFLIQGGWVYLDIMEDDFFKRRDFSQVVFYPKSSVFTIKVEKGKTYGIRIAGNDASFDFYLGNGIYGILLEEEECYHVDTETTRIKEPTCTQMGLDEIECTHCHEKWSEDIDMLEHSYPDDWTIIREATCTEKGEKQKICSACEKVMTSEIKIIKHPVPDDWTITDAPTCSSEGEREKVCSMCGEIFTEVMEKLPHTLPDEWTLARETACNLEGINEKVCSVCGESVTEKIAKLPHTLPDTWEIETEPTCKDNGVKTKTCSVCGEKVSDSIPKLNEHKEASKWKTTKEPTCKTKGEEQLLCKVCGKTLETRSLSTVECEYGKAEITKKPTESATGISVSKCIYCGDRDERVIPKLVCGDETIEVVKKEATCTTEGVIEEQCVYCGKVIYTTRTDAFGHKVTNWKQKTEATKTRNGIEEGTCTTCRKSVIREIKWVKPGMNGFNKDKTYLNSFIDVEDEQWYYDYVKTAYEYSLVNGITETHFSPDGKFTVAQAITICARIHSDYHENTIDMSKKNNELDWSGPYIAYCKENGILDNMSFDDYDRNITRGEMAQLFTSCLPEEEYREKRKGTLKDMTSSDRSYNAVKTLYGCGIITGDEAGNFRPNDEIVRSEACAIFTRIILPSLRVLK